MCNRKLFTWFIKNILCIFILLFPLTLHASFIESTIGAAVVNDATASYYNPAALTLLKNPQIITLGSVAYFDNRFTGQSIQATSGFTQSGTSNNQTHYFLPSLYLGIPITDNIIVGLATLSNFFNNNIDEDSILRYSQSNNSIRSFDLVPAIGIKFNEFISLGANINFSYANFILRPIFGIPSLNIPDSQSRNTCDGRGLGGDVGILLKPNKSTLIGLNYHSAITYNLNGKSILESNPEVISDHYSFKFWTPSSSVLSINYFLTPSLGFISTIRRLQWSIFKNINIRGIATRIGNQSVILNASVPYQLHDTWLLTLGTHYRISPNWIIRIAGSYNQSPANGNFQISNGDSLILGTSVSYTINKNIIIDGSYAHAFIQNKNIHIANKRNIIDGVNKAYRDAVSLKFTFNL